MNTRTTTSAASALLALIAAAGVWSCGSRSTPGTLATDPPAAGAVAPAGDGGSTPAAAAKPSAHAFHVRTVADGLLSGPVPHGDADFDRLAAMGVKTIISVDGAKPDVERAAARGMRYVHLPTTYSGIPKERQAEIARAVRDLPGPVFIHCHHGKHRGPAAAASAAVLLDLLTPEEAVAFMKEAGTAPSYPGLYKCVRLATPASQAVLDAASAEFPAVAPVPGFVEAMVQMEVAMGHLEEIRAAGWRAPEHHPDLVPAAEAGRLADLLRDVRHDEYVKKKDSEEFLYYLVANAARAQELEDAIVVPRPAAEVAVGLTLVAALCKDCQVRFRNE